MKTGKAGDRAVIRMMRFKAAQSQKGFALLLTLVFVGFFGFILASIVSFNRDQQQGNLASVAGYEATQYARAARVYVRDRMKTPGFTAPTPVIVGIDTDLKANGYLPPNFGRRVANNDYRNALDQKVNIVMLNYPPDATGVPTAYIYLQPVAATNYAGFSLAKAMLTTAEAARREGVAVSAPIYDDGGNNVTPKTACVLATDTAVTDPVVLWDTGCMSKATWDGVMAAAGLSFDEGGLVIPAWRAVKFDLRAVMRFPQPENAGGSTMLTHLQMGAPLADCQTNAASQVSVTQEDFDASNNFTGYSDAPSEPGAGTKTLCKVTDDTAAADRRFDLAGVKDIGADRLIVEGQAEDFTPDAGETFDIVNTNSTVADMKVAKVTKNAVFSTNTLVAENDIAVFDKALDPADVLDPVEANVARLNFSQAGNTLGGNTSLRIQRNFAVSVNNASTNNGDVVVTPSSASAGSWGGGGTVGTLQTDQVQADALNASDAGDRVLIFNNATADKLRVRAGGRMLTGTFTAGTIVKGDTTTVGGTFGVKNILKAEGTGLGANYSAAASDFHSDGGKITVTSEMKYTDDSATNFDTNFTANGTNSSVAELYIGASGDGKVGRCVQKSTGGYDSTCPDLQALPVVTLP